MLGWRRDGWLVQEDGQGALVADTANTCSGNLLRHGSLGGDRVRPAVGGSR